MRFAFMTDAPSHTRLALGHARQWAWSLVSLFQGGFPSPYPHPNAAFPALPAKADHGFIADVKNHTVSACRSLCQLIKRKQLLFSMPREDWDGSKRSRENEGGRKR